MMAHIHLEALQAHLTAGHISRRDFLKRAAALGFSLPVISAALAACGGDDDDDDDDTGDEGGDESGGAAPTATSASAVPTATQNITVQQNETPTPGEAEPSPTESEPAGQAGGSVTFVRAADSNDLDPVTNDGNVNIWIFMSIYDQLITVAENGIELAPGLATEWEANEDGSAYTFTIREGVKFSDGSDMTTDDIVWSILRARDTAESPWTFTLAQVQDVTAPDGSTIQITLTEPWAPFLSDISMFNASIVSKAFADTNGVEALHEQCMGTGPYALQEWKKEESLTLVRNENYWEEGFPLVDEIVINIVPDSNNQILQVQAGEVDGIIGQGDVPFNRVSDLDADDNLQVIQFTSTYNNFIVLNVRNAPLDDVNLRQALNYATDKQALIDTVLFGNAEIANSFMPRGALFWNPDQEGYPYDVDKAKELAAASSAADGATISILVRAGNQQQLQIATALKDMWTQIGIDLDIQQLDAAVVTEQYRANDFEMVLSGWTNDIIDPDELVSYAILPETTENYHTGWVNDEAVALANQGRATLDPEERRQIYYDIQRIHMEDAPFVYLYVVPYIDVLSARIKDYFHHPMGHYVFKRMYVEE
jgi:peptide/nickel transport system substrate-binding protein